MNPGHLSPSQMEITAQAEGLQTIHRNSSNHTTAILHLARTEPQVRDTQFSFPGEYDQAFLLQG